MSNRSAIRSWRQAAQRAGVAVTSLRRAIERGELPPPEKAADGMLTFDVEALDTRRIARSKPIAAAITASATAPRALPGFLAADLARHNVAVEDTDDEDEDDGQGDELEPHEYVPIGSSPRSGWPYSVIETAQQPEPTIIYIDRPVGPTAEQLATAIEPWRSSWRASRVLAIGLTIRQEATAAGSSAAAAWTAGATGAAAAEQLDDAQLGDEAWSMSVARGAGMAASQQVAAQERETEKWQQELVRRERQERELDDLTRMRRRRATRSQW
jgi:hypothetical protein